MNARQISITAICIAIVAVLIRLVQIPIPATTGGVTHPGAIAEIFIAIAFGPVVGGIAAGVGGAIADLTSPYASFAPLTLIAHGALGVLAGYLGHKKGLNGMIAGWIVGGLALIAVYFIGEATVYGYGMAGAVSELPFNLFQVALGILGLVLYRLVKQAYPQLEQLSGTPTFQKR